MAPKPEDPEAAARRAKKRELDRRAQRAARERTRSRIAHLEATVQAMAHQESGGRAASLMEQLEDMTRQRNDLARTLASIEGTVHAHREAEKASAGSAKPPDTEEQTAAPAGPPEPQDGPIGEILPPSNETLLPPDGAMLPSDGTAMDLLTPGPVIDLTPLSPGSFGLSSVDFLDNLTPPPAEASLQQHPEFIDVESIASPSLVIVPEPDTPCDCVSHSPRAGASSPSRSSIWRVANEALAGPGIMPKHILRYEDELGEDVPVRVVLEGWDSVERSQNMPPLWKKLRQTDELQFSQCGKAERLAIMRLMHTLLRYQAEPTAEQYSKLPPWYLSRPSQSLPHSSAIDFFAWPGVRERFIFSQHQYCSDFFWRVFADNFRLIWPFEFRDCYKRNMQTGLYSLSPDFEGRIRDIASWTMAPDFFQYFPEMYADIPVFQSLPAAAPSWMPGTRQVTARGMRTLEYGPGASGGKRRPDESEEDPDGDEWSRCNFV